LFAKDGTTSISATGGNASGSPSLTTISSSTSTTLTKPNNFSFDPDDQYNGKGHGPVAEWYMQSADNTKNIYGPAYITIWAKASTGTAINLTGYVAVGAIGNGNGNSAFSSIGSATVTGTGCGGYQEYTIGPIALNPNPKSIAKLQVLQVLVVDSGAASVQVGYNAATSAFGFADTTHIPSSITFLNGIAT
jgi:hypothetical protein